MLSLSFSPEKTTTNFLTGFRGSTQRIFSDAEGKSSRAAAGREEEEEAFAFFFLFLPAAASSTATAEGATAAAAAAAACLPLLAASADFSLAMASLAFFLSGSFGSGTSSLTIGTPWAGGGDASFLRAGTNSRRFQKLLPGAAMLAAAAAAPATTTTADCPPSVPRVYSWDSLGMCREEERFGSACNCLQERCKSRRPECRLGKSTAAALRGAKWRKGGGEKNQNSPLSTSRAGETRAEKRRPPNSRDGIFLFQSPGEERDCLSRASS